MSVKLEYIMSGTSYIGLHNDKTEEVFGQYTDILGYMKKNTNHDFGLLFNAFQEVKNGVFINKLSGLDSIHADSGGLQMITRGMVATEQDKRNIYEIQAKHSNVGMCFDVIPVETKSSSSRNDYSSRFFNPDNLTQCAKETGVNVSKQIETFLELGSECKPFIIAQGNCYDTYMKWVDVVMGEIPKDHHKYVGGVAMGAAALGTGYLEEVEKAFIASQLPLDTDKIHILGVGSMNRMMPLVAMIRGSLFDGKHISYDSTTHSSAVEMGRHTALNENNVCETLKYGKTYSKTYDIMFDSISDVFDHGLDKRTFMSIFAQGAGYARNNVGIDTFFLIKAAEAMVCATNFAKALEASISDDACFMNNVGKLDCVRHLESINNKSDYDHWVANFGRMLKSNRVSNSKSEIVTLEEFFN